MSTFQQDISKYIHGLAEFSSDIFWIKNSDFTQQIYISPAYEKIWGRTCESMYEDPKSWTDYIYPEDLERLHATVEKCRQNIMPGTKYTEIYRIKRPDGKVFWLKEKGFAIYDTFDNLIGFGGVAHDITNIKENERVEAEIQEVSEARDTYEEYLNSIIDSIAGNHWWKDKKGVYRGYNRTLLKSLGYKSPSEIIGKTDYELPWSNEADQLVAHDREVMRRGVAIEREEVVASTDGQKRVYLVNKAPLRNPDGEIIGTIGHGFDITEMKKAQEELEQTKIDLEKEKGGIENRLNAVIGMIVGNHWVKDLQGYYLACNDSLAQEHGLKDASEMIGKIDYELPWMDQADKFIAYDNEVIETGKSITQEHQILDKDGILHHYLVTKMPLRDHQGEIMGTIGNSTDITAQKKIETDLQAAKEVVEAENDAKSNYLSSINSGIRTPLNVILGSTEILDRKVLDPELKSSVSDLRQATNHLLAMISKTPDAIDKELEDDSQVLTLSESQVQAPHIVSFENCRVLVVEDNILNQKVTRVLLQDLGCMVTIASDGKEAIEKVESDRFDLIFMDIGLPEMDGVAVAKKLRDNNETMNIPIVILTAHVVEEELQRCHDAGMSDVLTKPISLNDLKQVLMKFHPNKMRELVEIQV